MAHLYQEQTANARTLLSAMGMGQYNQTMVIPYLFIPVATTDPDMAQIQLMVTLIQRRLNTLGHTVAVTGYLDPPTLSAIKRYTGPAWARMSWAEIMMPLVAAADVTMMAPVPAPSRTRGQALSGLGDFPSSDTLVKAGLVAGALYYFWKRRRR